MTEIPTSQTQTQTQGHRYSGSQGSQGSQWSTKEHRIHSGISAKSLKTTVQKALDTCEEPQGRRRSVLFDFVRTIKGDPEICDLPPEDAFTRVTVALRRIFASGIDPWIEVFELDTGAAELLFIETWNDVKYLPGDGPLETAARLARQRLVFVRGAPQSPRLYATFVAFIYHAQQLRGDKTVALPVRKVAQVLMGSDRHKDVVAAMLKRAQREGLLVMVRESHFRVDSQTPSRAREFRVNLELMEVVR